MRRGNKFGAVRVGSFASRVEADRHAFLAALERAGAIATLQAHAHFDVEPYGAEKIRYTPDFVYRDVSGELCGKANQLVACDVKGGPITDASLLRMKLFAAAYPQYCLLIVRRVRSRWDVVRFSERRASVKRRAA